MLVLSRRLREAQGAQGMDRSYLFIYLFIQLVVFLLLPIVIIGELRSECCMMPSYCAIF